MATTALILLITALAVTGYPDDAIEIPTREYKCTPLGAPIDRASIKLLREAIKEKNGESVVTSPLGVMMLLALYGAGTDGELREDITKFLAAGTPGNYSELSQRFSELTHEFKSLGGDYLNIASKVYVTPEGKLAPAFVSAAKSYESQVEQLDFKDTKAAAAIINKWADQETKGHIKDPVSSNDITSDVVAALFNIIYFQGHWHVPFQAKDTKEKDFHVSKSKVVKKPMMSLLSSLYYQESPSLGARLVELPYKEKGFRMIIVLPNEVDGLPTVLEKVASQGLLGEVSKLQPTGADVDLLLPKFEVRTKLGLNDILKRLGLKNLFEKSASGILEQYDVRVSKAFQEAFIKVDEEGATAGAFTGMIGFTMSFNSPPPQVIKFHVDRPFLYAILYEDTVLFAGTYIN